jgi:presenilin-like A22 family membrane protease
MIDGVAIGEVRPGYELWRPNREKSESVTTKFVIAFLLAATALIAALITITGFSLLSGGGSMGIICMIFALLYALFAYLVAVRWSRGILPVAAALSMILAILCAVGADSWFARDKAGFDEAMLPSSLIGLLVVILALLQIIVVAAALYGFNQNWHVEEERPIGSGEDYGAGAPPSDTPPLPA